MIFLENCDFTEKYRLFTKNNRDFPVLSRISHPGAVFTRKGVLFHVNPEESEIMDGIHWESSGFQGKYRSISGIFA